MRSGADYHRRRMQTAVKLDQELYGKRLSGRFPFQSLFELPFHFFGLIAGLLFSRWAAPGTGTRTVARFTAVKSKRTPPPLAPESAPNAQAVLSLVEFSEKSLKRSPAILFPISHPETSSDKAYVLGDLIYHVAKTCETLLPTRKFRVIQAIDGFALDTLPWPMAAAYAGFIHAGHIAIDRLPEEMPLLQRGLFRGADYHRAIFRVLQELREDSAVCIALNGGVVHNSRIFYLFKEIGQAIYFEAPRRRFPKREYEERVQTALSRPGSAAALQGALNDAERKELIRLMTESGIAESKAAVLLEAFEEELAFSTPYRVRFFRILINRMLRDKRPLLLIPLADKKSGEIVLNSPILITGFSPKTGNVRYGTFMEGKFQEELTDAESFARNFVRTKLNGL